MKVFHITFFMLAIIPGLVFAGAKLNYDHSDLIKPDLNQETSKSIELAETQLDDDAKWQCDDYVTMKEVMNPQKPDPTNKQSKDAYDKAPKFLKPSDSAQHKCHRIKK